MPKEPIEFSVGIYKSGRAFNFPKPQRDALGISGGDSVHLKISNSLGKILFDDRKVLMSGTEIYGKDLGALQPGSKVKVEASQPIFSKAKAEAQTFDTQERAAGFQSNPQIRRVVELFAMCEAKKHLCSLGYSGFKNTSSTECYDYICKFAGEN